MYEKQTRVGILFPPQGKKYPGAEYPTVSLLEESLNNFNVLADSLPELEEDTGKDISERKFFLQPVSQGTVSAAVAAGSLTPEEGRVVTIERVNAAVQDEQIRLENGEQPTMMALVRSKVADVRSLIEGLTRLDQSTYERLGLNITLGQPLFHSNDYGDQMGVIAGSKPLLEGVRDAVLQMFSEVQVTLLEGVIGGASHVPFREGVSTVLNRRFSELGIDFKDPRIPIIASTAGGKVLNSGLEVKTEITTMTHRPVVVPDFLKTWEELGINALLDVGPTRFGEGIIKSIRQQLAVLSLDERKSILLASIEERRQTLIGFLVSNGVFLPSQAADSGY